MEQEDINKVHVKKRKGQGGEQCKKKEEIEDGGE